MSESGLVRQVAGWVQGAQFEDLPRRVVEETKNQLLNGIAAIHAGHFSELGRALRRGSRDSAAGKDATIVPAGERATLAAAIFHNSSLGAALEYGDTMVASAAGQPTVAASLALAEKENLTGKQVLLGQALANEVAGRMGLMVAPVELPRPAWPMLERLAGAVVGAKALSLDEPAVATALGLALAGGSVEETLPAIFYASEGRAVAVAAAVQHGVHSAQLAAHGIGRPAEVLNGPDGLFAGSKRVDPGDLFASLGTTWLTETLSYKIYPVHAALCTIIDCTLDIVRQHALDPKKVRAVYVAAAPAAVDVDERVREFLDGPHTPIAALAYSISYNVAAALASRELTARQLLQEKVADAALWGLAGRVQVSRDDVFAERARAAWLARPLGDAGRVAVDLDPMRVSQFRLSSGARVRVELEDGRSLHAEQEVAAGFAGRAYDDRRKAVEDKFRRETRYSLRKERMEKAIDTVLHLERANAAAVRELVRLCCSERD